MTPIGEVAVRVADETNAGTTVVIVVVPLKESHLSIHTWPELGYAAIDLFSCGDRYKAEQAFNKLCNWFDARKTRIQIFERLAEVV